MMLVYASLFDSHSPGCSVRSVGPVATQPSAGDAGLDASKGAASNLCLQLHSTADAVLTSGSQLITSPWLYMQICRSSLVVTGIAVCHSGSRCKLPVLLVANSSCQLWLSVLYACEFNHFCIQTGTTSVMPFVAHYFYPHPRL